MNKAGRETEIKTETNTETTLANKPKTLSKAKRLFNKNYLLLWQGQFVSRLGTMVYSIVIALWLKEMAEANAATSSASGSIVGSFFMLSAIPMVLLSALGGAVADRFPRKKIIIFGDLFSGSIIIILSILLFTLPSGNYWGIVAVFIVGMLLSTSGSFFGPAISASVPDLVPAKKLNTANSMGQLSMKVSTLFGQGVGPILMGVLGVPLLVLINGITYWISAVSESFITIPQVLPEKVKGVSEYIKAFKNDLKEGIGYIWQNSGLKKMLLVSVFLNFFTMPIIILLMFYVIDFLGVPKQWYGFLLSFYGIGAFIGFTSAGLVKLKGKSRTRVLIAFMLAEPAGYILMAFMKTPIQAGALFFIGGIFNGFVMITIMTILQLTTPSNIRGRVFGTLTTISASIAPLGMGVGGFLYDMSGHNIALIYIGCGVVMIFLVTLISFSKDFRKFIAFEFEDETEIIGFQYKIRYLDKKEMKKDQRQIYLEHQLQKARSEL